MGTKEKGDKEEKEKKERGDKEEKEKKEKADKEEKEKKETPTPAATCKSWCYRKPAKWIKKCTWKNCKGCKECLGTPAPTTEPTAAVTPALTPAPAPVPAPAATCKPWCSGKRAKWIKKCTWKNCKGCKE